ncbi:MAG: flagellar basal body rod protein FlgB [Oscillospiraceae bacterium]|nr:flagellar basal body rod protein FlgB [Oscillospiraceae bacterium]
MNFNSVKSATMERSLSALWQRAQLISHNIANEDTPGYKAKRLAFENILQKEIHSARSSKNMSRSQKAAKISGAQSVIYDLKHLSGRADGNNVVLDNEHIELARVQLQYQALRDKINGHYANLKYAISGGR